MIENLTDYDVLDYKVLRAKKLDIINEELSTHISAGYIPFQEMVFWEDSSNVFYTQTVIKLRMKTSIPIRNIKKV